MLADDEGSVKSGRQAIYMADIVDVTKASRLWGANHFEQRGVDSKQ